MYQAILKLAALKGKLDLGEDVSTQKIATDFMMFAAKSDGSQVGSIASNFLNVKKKYQSKLPVNLGHGATGAHLQRKGMPWN